MSEIASYQSANDYNLVKEIRPFDPGYSGTMNEIATKNQYFKVAADRMKSMYDDAVGLDPQFAQNREYLKNFMSEANKNLGKITKSDLSIMDNSAEAANVFKPLYDASNPFNRRLMADSQINKHYQKQQQLSDTYRTKDGGKEWNQNNDFYFRDAQQKYLEDAKAGNLDSIDQHFQSKKSYIPYYDFKKEITDIQEACQGYSTQRKDITKGNNLYFQETSKKGCSPVELALAFETGLSDRAKQQMSIDGYVHFKSNEDILAQKFTDIAVNIPQKQVDDIKATIAGIKDGGVSKDEQTRLNYYEQQLSILEPKLKQGKEAYEAMIKGNSLEYVTRNYDKLAGQIHFGELTNRLATAYRTDEEKNIVSTNPAGMLQLRLETDRANMYIQDQFDQNSDYRGHQYKLGEIEAKGNKDIEVAKLKGEVFEGTSTPSPAFINTGKNVIIPKVTENEFKENNLKPALQNLNDSYSVVNQHVKKALNSSTDLNHQQLTNYITELENKKKKGEVLSPDGERTINAYNKYKENKYTLAAINDEIAAINTTIKDKNPELFNDSGLNDKPIIDYKLRNTNGTNHPSVPISEKDMFNIISGKNINGFTIGYKIIPAHAVSSGSTGGGFATVIPESKVETLYYKGSEVDISSDKKIGDMFRKIFKTRGDKFSEINRLKTEAYTDNYYENSPFTKFKQSDFGKDKEFTDRYGKDFQRLLNVTGGLGEKNGYDIIFRDNTGEGIYVRLLDEDGNPESYSEKTLARLQKETPTGAFVDKKSVGNGYAYYIPGMLPRYSNLPDNQTLEKYNKVQRHIRSIEKNLNENLTFKNAITMDSKELPVGSTSRYLGNTGVEYIISIRKEKGSPNTYVASWTLEDGTIDEIEAESMDQLLPNLDKNPKKK